MTTSQANDTRWLAAYGTPSDIQVRLRDEWRPCCLTFGKSSTKHIEAIDDSKSTTLGFQPTRTIVHHDEHSVTCPAPVVGHM